MRKPIICILAKNTVGLKENPDVRVKTGINVCGVVKDNLKEAETKYSDVLALT